MKSKSEREVSIEMQRLKKNSYTDKPNVIRRRDNDIANIKETEKKLQGERRLMPNHPQKPPDRRDRMYIMTRNRKLSRRFQHFPPALAYHSV
jgi:hypothetical protein